MPEAFDPAKVTSPHIGSHGGSCCGISHIFGFPSTFRLNGIPDADAAEKRIRYLIGKYWFDSGRVLDERKNRLYEIVLQQSQRKLWEPVILKIGFKPVTSFINTNSGHRVIVYHYAMGPRNDAGPYVSPYEPEAKSDIPNPFRRAEPVVY